jgi:hypothetical protein
MIRVITIVGEIEFEEADAYTVSPPNLPPGTGNFGSTQLPYPTQTLPGGLKLWKMDPTGEENHTLVAWFSPTGWLAIDFRESEPVTQLAPMGFMAANGKEQGEQQQGEQARVARATPRPTPRTTSQPTPKATPVER